MARPKGTTKEAMAQRRPSGKHIEYIDIDNSGTLKEVVVVKRWEDGGISYIETGNLDGIDRGRLKTILSSIHADKYEMWELLLQSKLNNGMNGLEYFHQLTKRRNAKGGVERVLGTSLRDAQYVSDKMIGSEFTNPGEIAGVAGNSDGMTPSNN